MKKRVIAVGFFDGVHKGHMALINKVLQVSGEKNCSSAVFTFKKHPDEVVFNTQVPLLCSNEYRETEILNFGGVDEVFFWDFDEKNAAMPWDDFVRDVLIEQYNACHIVTGADFRFGHKGIGDSKKLAELCDRLGVGYDAIDEVCVDNQRVSSSNIRKLIEQGDVEQAKNLLGHPYSVQGIIEHGRKVGRTIGIRTINLSLPTEMQKPANGVYISRVTVEGKAYQGVTNVGTVPTFLNDDIIIIEAHLLEFSKDVYGKRAKVEFLKFLRFEKKFESIDELKATILQNIEQTKKYFKENVL
ncbi:MAG: bifunctional riboflavin kinase/FAD synthetase [Clostridia bacterium]